MAAAYTNGRFLLGEGFDDQKAILVDLGIICDIVDKDKIPERYTIVDMEGMNVAPALIDLQIYGGNGFMFSDTPTHEALEATYNYCLAGGASRFMITIATNSMDVFQQGIEAVRSYQANGGKGLIGLHLEGPYINPLKKGAHLEQYIRKPDLNEIKMLLDKGSDVIKMITVAPELCNDEIMEYLVENIMIVSAGHSNASYQQAQQAFGKGIPAATHLFNAMTGMMHRAPGMVGAIFNDATVLSSIVCDGIHVDFAAVRIAKKQLGERLFYITDAVTESRTGDYQHRLNADHYVMPDGTLSGSSLTMMQSVKNGIEKAGINPEESLRMAAAYPGSLLTRDLQLGKIQEGCIAEFVVFDDEYKVDKVVTGHMH